ncbi:MAG: hypothetical protein UV74_C0013G0016 [Candidatus Woesebacteria bacterium GW2011_GWB1_43_14]|uniref:F-type ATPase subunit delta n=1 Tax=Candidatus Woesebacteria bacterium GW2011_GWB1_43_14 TaxID=1618578 RepID=A0A0G1DGS6_9BACT|nr:MAG: hypothetical protein UV51_C0009G0019 [Candidatus Woesebacteria bacterium GW2011_GWC1_42_9]KKS96894.1 MAG: hypothetical protein UV74_C0013G0016 [Candidatus Woesebacteria bacterium GW2011_GWB1_43_14]
MRFSNILSLIRTSSELALLSTELGDLRDEDFQGTKKSDVRMETREAVRKDFEASKLEKDQFFSELEAILDGMPELVLEVSIQPGEGLIEKIYEWLLGNMENKVIVNFVIKPELIGGATISFQGKFGDYSLCSVLTNEGF